MQHDPPSFETVEASKRLLRERDYHNRRYGADEADPRAHLDKAYVAIVRLRQLQADLLRSLGRGKAVLEYGCADGGLSIDMLDVPTFAGTLDGIDISDNAIATANDKARRHGIENARFQMMNAEALRFADDSFDVVFGSGILHHLELNKAFSEIARVLRPGGTAVFLEPLGHNPVLNWYRERTPGLRTPDEHPLLKQDLKLAERYFQSVDSIMAGLTTPIAALVSNTQRNAWIVTLLDRCDQIVFRIPGMRWQAWFTCLVMRK